MLYSSEVIFTGILEKPLARKPYAADIAYHMILPVMVVTIVAFAGTALLTRTTMMEVLKGRLYPHS